MDRREDGSGRPVRVLSTHMSAQLRAVAGRQSAPALKLLIVLLSDRLFNVVFPLRPPWRPSPKPEHKHFFSFALQLKNKFMKKIPRDAEASNVLVGEVDFLNKPFVAFVRLAQATTLGGLTEVPVPTR